MTRVVGANMRIYRQSQRLAEKELAARRAANALLPRRPIPSHAIRMAWGAAVRIVDAA